MSGTDKTNDRANEYFGESNFPAPYLTGGEAPSEYEKANIRVVERVLEEFWFKGEVEKGPEFFAPDCWRYDPLMPDAHGPEAYAAMVTKYHKAFEFQENDLQIVMADQNWIAWRAVTKCKHVGDFEGIPGTGAQCSVVSHTFVCFNEQHKAREGWALTDYLSLVIQMFFALNWFQRLLYLPRFYKALTKIKRDIDLPPTNPSGKRHLSTQPTT